MPLPEPGKGFLAAVRLTCVILPGPVAQRAASGRHPGDDQISAAAWLGTDGCGCYRWWLSRVLQVLRGVGRVLAGLAGGERSGQAGVPRRLSWVGRPLRVAGLPAGACGE